MEYRYPPWEVEGAPAAAPEEPADPERQGRQPLGLQLARVRAPAGGGEAQWAALEWLRPSPITASSPWLPSLPGATPADQSDPVVDAHDPSMQGVRCGAEDPLVLAARRLLPPSPTTS